MAFEIKKTGATISSLAGILTRGMNSLIRVLLFSTLVLSVYPEQLFAEDGLNCRKTTVACDSAQKLLVHQKYSQASRVVGSYLKKNPRDNDALYLSFAIEQTRILDYESYMIDCKEYLEFADSLRVVFEKRLLELHGDDSVICLFYLANVYGGMSIVQAKTGNWFDAVKNAVPSVSLLKEVRRIHPDFYAAYLGLGVFNYYLRNSFKWLPFVDDKEDDLKTLETALKASFPFDYAAKNTLCWILIEKNQYKRSDSLALSVLKEIPDNTIFFRIRLMVALWTQQYSTTVQMADRFIKMTMEREPRNWSDLVAGYSALIDAHEALGDFAAMKIAINSINKMKIPPEFAAIPHIKKSLKRINELKVKYKNAK